MRTITRKDIEDVVKERTNRTVSFIGNVVNDDLIKTRPRKFGFWVEDGSFMIISDADIAMALQEKEDIESGKNLSQDKLI